MLTIQLYKNTGKPSILKCIREDKSETWSKLHPNTEYHDLAHIAVEKTLGYKDAFYGLVAKGVNIEDFELPEEKKPKALQGANLPRASLVTEHLVNLLTIEQFNTGLIEDFIGQTRTILKENDLPYPDNLTEETLTTIRNEFTKLISEWKTIEGGEYLENQFEL